MITDISQLDPNGTYTYADYLNWEFEEWVELLNRHYRMFNKPGKSPLHQQVARSLGYEIMNQIGQPYDVWPVPLPIILGHQPADESPNLVIPDSFVIDTRPPNVLDEVGWNGVPRLVVEVADKLTIDLDTTTKFGLYQHHGVPEYWVVRPDERAVYVYTLQTGTYSLVDVYESDTIPCQTFPGLIVSHERIFR